MGVIINLTNRNAILQMFIATVFKVYDCEFRHDIVSNIDDSPSLTS